MMARVLLLISGLLLVAAAASTSWVQHVGGVADFTVTTRVSPHSHEICFTEAANPEQCFDRDHERFDGRCMLWRFKAHTKALAMLALIGTLLLVACVLDGLAFPAWVPRRRWVAIGLVALPGLAFIAHLYGEGANELGPGAYCFLGGWITLALATIVESSTGPRSHTLRWP